MSHPEKPSLWVLSSKNSAPMAQCIAWGVAQLPPSCQLNAGSLLWLLGLHTSRLGHSLVDGVVVRLEEGHSRISCWKVTRLGIACLDCTYSARAKFGKLAWSNQSMQSCCWNQESLLMWEFVLQRISSICRVILREGSEFLMTRNCWYRVACQELVEPTGL